MKINFIKYGVERLKMVLASPVVWFLIFSLLLTWIHTSPAMSFRKKPTRNPEKIITTLKERLNLTEAQIEQIRPIVSEQSEKKKELFEKYRSQGHQGRSSMRADMQVLRAETDARLAEVFSDEQMKEFHKLQSQQREQRKKRFRQPISHMIKPEKTQTV